MLCVRDADADREVAAGLVVTMQGRSDAVRSLWRDPVFQVALAVSLLAHVAFFLFGPDLQPAKTRSPAVLEVRLIEPEPVPPPEPPPPEPEPMKIEPVKEVPHQVSRRHGRPSAAVHKGVPPIRPSKSRVSAPPHRMASAPRLQTTRVPEPPAPVPVRPQASSEAQVRVPEPHADLRPPTPQAGNRPALRFEPSVLPRAELRATETAPRVEPRLEVPLPTRPPTSVSAPALATLESPTKVSEAPPAARPSYREAPATPPLPAARSESRPQVAASPEAPKGHAVVSSSPPTMVRQRTADEAPAANLPRPTVRPEMPIASPTPGLHPPALRADVPAAGVPVRPQVSAVDPATAPQAQPMPRAPARPALSETGSVAPSAVRRPDVPIVSAAAPVVAPAGRPEPRQETVAERGRVARPVVPQQVAPVEIEREASASSKPALPTERSRPELDVPTRTASATSPRPAPAASPAAAAHAEVPLGNASPAPVPREIPVRPQPEPPRAQATRPDTPVAPAPPAVPRRTDVATTGPQAPKLQATPPLSEPVVSLPLLRAEPARIAAVRPAAPKGARAVTPSAGAVPGVTRRAERLNLGDSIPGGDGAAKIGIDLPQGGGGPDPAASLKFVRAVSTECMKLTSYPAKARNLGQHGTVVLRLMVSPSAKSRLRSVSVERSSGHELLDKEAMEGCLRVPKLPRPPPGLEDRDFPVLLPIEFVLTEDKR